MKFKFLSSVSLLATLIAVPALAEGHHKKVVEDEPAAEASAQVEATTPTTHWYNHLGFDTGVHWGFGRMGTSTNNTIPNRNMNTLSLQALPGYKVQNLLVGPYFEYLIVGQNTDPSDASNLTLHNQNIKGNGYLLGVGASYEWLKFNFGAAFTFIGNYSLSLQDTAGFYAQFQKPIGVNLQAGYRVYKKLTADLKFSTVSYAQDNVANVANDVSTNKRTHWDLALGATLHVDFK